MSRWIGSLGLFLVLPFFVSTMTSASSSPWVSNKHGQVRLISSLDRIGASGEVWLGLQFRTIPGWHVYWKNAGDAGYPPKISWQATQGFKDPVLEWPAPHRYSLPGDIAAYGYEGEVVYPIRVTRTQGSLHAEAQVSYLTCGDSCVPYKVTLALDTPEASAAATDVESTDLIESFRHQIAVAPDQQPEIQIHPRLIQYADHAVAEFTVHAPRPLSTEDVDIFFDKNDTVTFGAPVVSRSSDDDLLLQVAVSTLTGAPVPATLPVDYTFTLKSFHGDHVAIENQVTLTTEKSAMPEPAPAALPPSIIGLLILGFLGGLILNIMPCVLPVLSIKLLGLLQSSGSTHGIIVRRSLASAAGIMASFEVLATIVIVARQAGHAVGWGIQFQQPIFIGAMFVIVVAFALNLWGVYEIAFPNIVGKFATSYGQRDTATAYFMSGVFATLLATPCSAPFLGTAMGFALAEPAANIVGVFTAAGLGMGLPYFLLALFPSTLRWLPRPGRWMLVIKNILGGLLMATAIWLGMIFWAQVQGPKNSTASVVATNDIAWIPFDESAIPTYLAQGRVVFVDVTADWCFTCKVNERRVLESADIVQAFKQHHVVMMRADWTNHDDAIAAFLKSVNRAGIPFNAFYRPGQAPIILSEFLTKSQVLSALKSADPSH